MLGVAHGAGQFANHSNNPNATLEQPKYRGAKACIENVYVQAGPEGVHEGEEIFVEYANFHRDHSCGADASVMYTRGAIIPGNAIGQKDDKVVMFELKGAGGGVAFARFVSSFNLRTFGGFYGGPLDIYMCVGAVSETAMEFEKVEERYIKNTLCCEPEACYVAMGFGGHNLGQEVPM